MNYLDPKKQFNHRVTLIVGYVVVAVAITIATLILLYQAYGFGLGQNGSVIQSGLLLISSQPSSAQIYIDGVTKSQTNSRTLLLSGLYDLKLTRSGYRDWSHLINIQGGSVTRFEYPFLFPTNIKSIKLQGYATPPTMTTQSPDRRWLVVQRSDALVSFEVYDLKNATKTPTVINLPVAIVSKAVTSESWRTVEWADDNQHFLVQHDFDGKVEYLLVDRQNVVLSINLNTSLSVGAVTISLDNAKYDQYYIYNASLETLQTASLSTVTPVALLDHVIAYKTYGTDNVLYVTDTDSLAGKVQLKLLSGNQTYTIRSFSAGSSYLLDMAIYNSQLYVAAGAVSDNKIYIYKDPIGQLQSLPSQLITPIHILHISAANYLGFSILYQFVVAEHGSQFDVYDIENNSGYNYTLTSALDAPQAHASWMDGYRLTYVSAGKLLVFDFDGTNQQLLLPVSANYLPFFAPDYKYLYDFSNSPTDPALLEQTSLLAI